MVFRGVFILQLRFFKIFFLFLFQFFWNFAEKKLEPCEFSDLVDHGLIRVYMKDHLEPQIFSFTARNVSFIYYFVSVYYDFLSSAPFAYVTIV